MNEMKNNGPEKIVYKGDIFEIVKQPMIIGDKKVVFEIARRAPGVRLIIVKNNKIIVTREFRTELGDYDYRLPGGKVFDSLSEYKNHFSDDILSFAIESAKHECREEVGLIVKNINHFITTKSGATVIWDLIYFVVDDFEKNEIGQELEIGEKIDVEWKTFEEIKKLCKEGKISEDRSVGVLFKFFLQYPKKYIK